MKILLLGKDGQVGWELQRALSPLGELIALNRHGDTHWCGDLRDFDNLQKTVETLKPDVIVNAAAYTAVDKAESELQLAHDINAKAPGILAKAAASIDALLVHYSTDYVFNGSGSKPWTEYDLPAPINHYGKTKLEGEQLIQASDCHYLIFRTSWVYGLHGNNFIKTMLRLMQERESLQVIQDQIGAPTGADLIADMTSLALLWLGKEKPVKKIYHLAPTGSTSWYDYARFILEKASANSSVKCKEIKPIQSKEYPTPAARPCNSRLNTHQLSEDFSLYLPAWEEGVDKMLTNFLG